MALTHHAASAVHAVAILAEEAEFLRKENVSLTEEIARLKGNVSILEQEKNMLYQEMEKSKKQKHTLISQAHTQPISRKSTSTPSPKLSGTQGRKPIRNVLSLFSTAFNNLDTDDGWISLSKFCTKLYELDPTYESSSYWKGKGRLTVKAYPDLIEHKIVQNKYDYVKLKECEFKSNGLSSPPSLTTRSSQSSSSSIDYEPSYGYSVSSTVSRGDERTDARSEKDTRQGIYDPRYVNRYLGTEVRDHGPFGSLPLSDDYSEEANP